MTTIQGVDTYHLPDRVHRQWDQGALDKVWISDITYLRTNEGWLYLCAVRDGCSRRVLGWSLDSVQRYRFGGKGLAHGQDPAGEDSGSGGVPRGPRLAVHFPPSCMRWLLSWICCSPWGARACAGITP